MRLLHLISFLCSSSPIELQLYSPALRVDARGPLAVFNDNDQLSGKVMLDFQAHHTGRLVVTVSTSSKLSRTR